MKTDSRIQVSVVVPTYCRPDLLERCLEALQRQTLFPADYEIIICDDGPSEMANRVVRNARAAMPNGPQIHYLEVTQTQGPAGARNIGWQYSRAPYIAFTDDDTIPDSEWLKAGLDALVTGADAVSGHISMPLPKQPTDIELDAAGLTHAEFVTANCFLRRDILTKLGGFDERFAMAWREDSDLHFSLIETGHSIVKAPSALVTHPLRPMSFSAGIGMQKKIVYDVLLFRKHPKLYRERIRQSPPWLYLSITLLLALAVVFALAGRADFAIIALGLWGVLTLRFFLTRLVHSAFTIRNALEVLLTSIAIPPLSIFWRMVGISRYGMRFP